MLTENAQGAIGGWRRINMRKVEHLLGVELMHDLYSQHDYKINSVRFRNTFTFWKNGIVNSYAPQSDWDEIASYLGGRFRDLDPLLISQLESLYNLERTFAESYLETIDLDSLSEVNNLELKRFLVNVQHFTLGDLYRLNFVQVEHALTHALLQILDELAIPRTTLASLIISNKLTEFQKEELEFVRICREGNRSASAVQERIQNHWRKYAYMHCAYGELPYSYEYYVEKYEKIKDGVFFDIESSIRVSAQTSYELLQSIASPKLEKLVGLMIRGGEFRDSNKARLGQSMKYKFALLDEVAKRTNVDRQHIRFYSLFEICHLLDNDVRLAHEQIERRKCDGIVLARTEFLNTGHTAETRNLFPSFGQDPVETSTNNSTTKERQVLEAVCASRGKVSGVARIILSSQDGKKISHDDIMIAVGTDFDLMDAIQRSAAVVTEEGGLLSHAAVVCRELKKPCCIAVVNATTKIRDGDKITVDADTGKIVIESSATAW